VSEAGDDAKRRPSARERTSSRQRSASGDAPPSSRSGGPGGERRRRVKRRRVEEPEPSAGSPLRWVLVLVGVAVAVAATYVLVVYPASRGPGAGKPVEVVFERDEPLTVSLQKLESAGVLASPRVFGLYVRLVGGPFAPGKHLVTDDLGPQDLLRCLERNGAGPKARIVIPEGWNRFDIGKRLEAQHVATQASFVAATQDPVLLRELALDGDSAEGFLFPATYDLPRDSDPREIVRRLKAEFERRFTLLEQSHRLGRAALESSLGWSRREIVTLASMVEKEAAVDEERPIIASVFLNRLRDPAFKRKVLQCDPTAGYGCLVLKEKVPACAGFTGKITHAVNTDPQNTYSTYVHEGLPPGPIANPGLKSLEAVLAPASTKYLYFVTRGEARRHAFSETLEEHNTAVKDLRERSQQREH